VVEPLPTPGDDSHAYYGLAKALYAEGSFGDSHFEDSSDWSPGAPLLYAAGFYATGGAREGTARIIELLLGLATIVVVYLLGRRIACRQAGLLAAFAVAVYPPFIHSVGILASEPPAMLTLPAAVLAFLWASDGLESGPSRGWRDPRARWLVPGLLFGLTAMFRPEYLVVGVAFAGLALIRVWRARSWRPGLTATALLLAALLLPIVPWAIRNQVVLHRTVPISTGGGKALYVGTFLPADGEYRRVKAILAKRYLHREYDPHSQALEEVDPVPLFNRVADRYPDLPRDSALGKIGKRNFSHYFGEDPVEYMAMTARKAWRMWSAGIGEAMESTAGRVIQTLIVALALAGLLVLAWRRWWWELVAMATPIALVTAVGAISLAAPRRNEVLMTLIFPLAAAALSRGTAALLSRR
jgi:4-amino-4-deoxy-L-arabinose transferase-like glycosyltransferase